MVLQSTIVSVEILVQYYDYLHTYLYHIEVQLTVPSDHIMGWFCDFSWKKCVYARIHITS